MARTCLGVILMALLLLASACGGGRATPEAAPTTAAAAVAQPAATATAIPPTATTVPTEPPATPTAIAQPTEPPAAVGEIAALDELDSYRTQITMSSQGIDASGADKVEEFSIFAEVTADPPARHMVINAGEAAEGRSFEMYQIGDDLYMQGEEGMGWIRISQEQSPLQGMNPALISGNDLLFANPDQLERAGPDQKINGVDSKHYKFDKTVLGILLNPDDTNVTAEGDVWIAKDGGYVTKYEMAMTWSEGSTSPLNPQLKQGSQRTVFEIKDVNADFTIELPEGATAGTALAGFDDQPFPVPENGVVQMSGANMAIVRTDLSQEDAQAFYEKELAALDWAKDDAGSMAMPGIANLAFTKGDNRLSLMIASDPTSEETQVMATVE